MNKRFVSPSVSSLLAACLFISIPSAPGSTPPVPDLEPGDEVKLLRSESLLFRGEPFRTAKEGERFVVLKVSPEAGPIYILAVDKSGREIAVTVQRDAVAKTGSRIEALRERALAAMKEGKLEEAGQSLLEISKIAPADSRLTVLRTKLNDLGKARASVTQAKAEAAKARQIANAKRRNANVADRPNGLSSSDNSNRTRADTMRQEADEIEASAALSVREAENAYASLRGTELPSPPGIPTQGSIDSVAAVPGKEPSAPEMRLQRMRRQQEAAILQNRLDSDFAKWLALPINTERFAAPESLVEADSPSYSETLEFINGKIGPLMTLGFGERSKKMILRFNFENGPGFTAVFNPRELNAAVRYQKLTREIGQGITRELRVEGRVILEARNGEPKILVYEPHSSEAPTSQHSLTIGETGLLDGLTAERLADAFSRLVVLFGGKEEPF